MIIPEILILLILMGTAFFIVMLFNIQMGIFIFFVTLPFQNIFIPTPVMFISLSDIFAALIFISWLIMVLLGRAKLPKKRVLFFVVVLWGLILIGCFSSIDQRTSLRFTFRLLSYFAIFVVLLSVIDSMRMVKLMLYAMALQLLLISVVTNWKYVTSDIQIQDIADIDEEYEHSAVRKSGIAHNMNTTAYNIAILMPLTLGLYMLEKRKELILVLGISLSALLITMSRGGWVAFTASLFFLPKLRIRQVLVLALIFVLVFSVFYTLFVGRIEATNLKSDSISVRLLMYDFSWDLFKEHPITGIGGGNFSINAYRVFPDIRYRLPLARGYCSSHNQYLGLLVENGLIAFLIYIGFLVYSGFHAVQRKKLGNTEISIFRRAVLASFVVLIVYQMFAYFGLRNYLFWGVIALIYCSYDIAMKENEKEQSFVPHASGENVATTFIEDEEAFHELAENVENETDIFGPHQKDDSDD